MALTNYIIIFQCSKPDTLSGDCNIEGYQGGIRLKGLPEIVLMNFMRSVRSGNRAPGNAILFPFFCETNFATAGPLSAQAFADGAPLGDVTITALSSTGAQEPIVVWQLEFVNAYISGWLASGTRNGVDVGFAITFADRAQIKGIAFGEEQYSSGNYATYVSHEDTGSVAPK